MTRRDKWKQRPPVMRYRMFCDEARFMESGARKRRPYHLRFADAAELEQEKARSYGRPAPSAKSPIWTT